jgi:phage gp45-like
MDRSTLEQIARILRPLSTRVANLVARATVQRVDDGTSLQKLQVGVLKGEDVDDGERFQQYGFSSTPLAGSEAVVLFPNGDRAHPLVVAVDDRRYRPTGGDPGDVNVFHHTGARILINQDGDIVVTPATGRHVLLGSDAAADPPALKSDLDTLKSAISAAPIAPLDGGAAFKAGLVSALASWPIASQKVKAQ